MSTLVLTQPEVRRLLPMDVCMDLVQDALATLARGGCANPLRRGMRLPEGSGRAGLIGTMPGYLAEPEALGLKVVGVFPGNHGGEFDAHQGVVMLFDLETGVPSAILDAAEVTAIRTAAASGVATRVLAREDASDLALIGSGVQARTHLEAMRVARDLRRVRVFSPSAENRRAFAALESERTGLEVEPTGSAREAVEGADLICTTTSAREPVLCGAWIAPGAHVNAAGACVPTARELDTAAVAAARVYTDRAESLRNEAGDFLIPLAEGAITDDHLVGELGDVLLGRAPGRGAPNEITLFESLGIAVEDLAAAQHVLARARAQGVGTAVELGGRRHAAVD
jgi:ornithine cyclodeaminase